MAAFVCVLACADEANIALATRAFEDGFYDVAARQIEDALRDGVPPALSNRLLVMAGQCYYELGRWSNAVEVLQQVRARVLMQ